MKHKGHLEMVDPNTGEVDDKRVWLVNNQIVFTDDGFKTSKSVLGEFTIGDTTYFGLLAQAVIAGLVEGSTIRGNTILGGTINIGNGAFVVEENGTVHMNDKDSTINSDQINGIVGDIAEIQKKKMYRAEVTCADPLIFKNRDQKATLTAKVMSWDDDETDNFIDRIVWKRKSNNAESDKKWNDQEHKGKTLTIGTDDVAINANFYCEVSIPEKEQEQET